MKTQDVKLYAAQQLHRLQALPDNQRRAELAKLRRGIGHAPGELPELWGSFLLGMPESFQGRSAPSAAEWAVYLALTLYAMHQQGNDRLMNCPGNTLGRAVRQLAERNSAGQDWTEASVPAVQRAGHRRRNYRDQPPSAGHDPAVERGKGWRHPAGLSAACGRLV